MTDDTAVLIEQLQRMFEQTAEHEEDPGATLYELSQATGKSEHAVRRKLRDLAIAGQIECIQTRRISPLTGKLHFSYVYRPVETHEST